MAELEISGTPARFGDSAQWSVTEATNGVALGMPSPGTGSVSGTNWYGSESELAIEKSATFKPTPFPTAQLEGVIDSVTVSGTPGMDADVVWSMSSYFGGLSVERVAPPVLNQTLGSIISTYIGLVYPSPAPVLSTRIPFPGFDSDLYSFPGWRGNVWNQICDLLAKVRAEIVYWPDENGSPAIEVRPMGSVDLDIDDSEAPTVLYEQGSPGHQIDVTYQNQRVITSVLPDLINYSENPSVESSATGWGVSLPTGVSASGSSLDVAWGDDTFVIVGLDYVATSPNGIAWTDRTIPSGDYRQVAWNGSFFVTHDLNTSTVYTSPDGITWTSQGTTTEYIERMVSGPGVFLGVSGSSLLRSVDGVNWNSASVSGYFRDITYGDGMYVAVGEGVAASSPDGITWTARAVPNRNFRGVAWGEPPGGGIFVAVGWDGSGPCLAVSYDGISWISGSTSGLGNANAVAWNPVGGRFVTDNSSSLGGITWSPASPNNAVAYKIVPGPSVIVGVSDPAFGVQIALIGDTWANYIPSGGAITNGRNNDPAQAFRGDYSYRIRLNVVSGIGIVGRQTVFQTILPTVNVASIVGSPFTLGVWLKIYNNPASGILPSSARGRVDLVFRDASGNAIARQRGGSGTTTFGFSAMTGTVPAGAETVESTVTWMATVDSISGFGTDVRLHADAHFIINAAYATYFDGDYEGAGWLGTPNNSASIRPNPDNIPLYDAFEDNNNIMEVSSGETATYIITSGVYPTSINQPVPVDTLPINVGNYHVIDSTGLPIVPQQWVDYGGHVAVAVGDGPGEIVVTITGPPEDIPSTTGPYRLAASDGANEYATLSVAGTGIITRPQVLNLLTGADRDRVTQELAATVDSPFVNTLADAYTVGAWLSGYSNGFYPVVNITIPTASLGGVGLGPGSVFNFRDNQYRVLSANWDDISCFVRAIRYSTVADYEEAIGARTIGDHDALWGEYTVRDFEIKSHKVAS